MPKVEFLRKKIMAFYSCPKGLGRDRNEHRIANLQFQAPIEDLGELPVSIERASQAFTQRDGMVNVKLNWKSDPLSIEIRSVLDQQDSSLVLSSVVLDKFLLFRNEDDPSIVMLRFHAKIRIDETNASFVVFQFGTTVCLKAFQTQGDLDFAKQQEEVAAGVDEDKEEGESDTPNPEGVDADLRADKPKRNRKPGKTIPRQLGGGARKRKAKK